MLLHFKFYVGISYILLICQLLHITNSIKLARSLTSLMKPVDNVKTIINKPNNKAFTYDLIIRF